MAWWKQFEKPEFRGLAGRRADKRRTASRIEWLEPKALLGSMMPTDTGTLAGDVLPITDVEQLSPAEKRNLSAADLALLEAEQSLNQVRSDIDALDQSAELAGFIAAVEQQAQDAEQATPAASAQADHPGANGESSRHEARSEQPPSPATAQDETASDVDAELLDAMAEATDGAAEDDSEASIENSDADHDGETDSEEAADGEKDSKSEDGETKHDPGEPFDRSSSAPTGSLNLTFAGGGGPSDRPQTVSPPPNHRPSGGGGTGSDTGSTPAIPGFIPLTTADVDSSSTAITANGEQVVVRYDFRSLSGYANEISAAEQASAQAAFQQWEAATGNQLRFERDTTAANEDVVIVYKGDLAAVGFESSGGEVLGVGGSVAVQSGSSSVLQRVIAVDRAERLDTQIGNGNPEGTYDFATIVGHEMGHVLGINDATVPVQNDLMNPVYDHERGLDSYQTTVNAYEIPALTSDGDLSETSVHGLHTMITGYPQLSAAEVADTLDYATTVTPSDDAIIAIVDRGGNILGVRVEDGVIASFDAIANGGNGNGAIDTAAEQATLVFAIDGAVSKARTAAFFANGDPVNGTLAPITSRLLRFISQSTITFREVNSNPNTMDPLTRGPGLVAPIGLGGHFPPEIAYAPPVDLFHIETTNRDSLLNPGPDRIRGTADDITLTTRFNIDPNFVPFDSDGDGQIDNPDTDLDGLANLNLNAPESYGFVTGLLPTAQNRGFATLPGGVPIYRDTNGDGVGETLIGGVGVFFPGNDGTALFEQNYQAGVNQSEKDRTNAPKVIEAEFIAAVTAGGSVGANARVSGLKPGNHPVPDIDIPFGRLDLVGIQLEVLGPTAGIRGLEQLRDRGFALGNILDPLNQNGMNQVVNTGGAFTIDGQGVPFGWLVDPHDGGDFNGDGNPDITAADVRQIINAGITEAEQVRAAIRLPLGSRTRMVYAVADESGEILGLFRQRDATIFSIEVAVSKARNTAYYADSTALQPVDFILDQSSIVDAGFNVIEDGAGNFIINPGAAQPAGLAATNRTFRFLAEPRFPSGQEGTLPGNFSILYDIASSTGRPMTDLRALVESADPIPFTEFNTVLGFNSFNPSTNFRDPDNPENQSGVVFFPGSTPLYRPDGTLIGGFGVSGDGVDQDDVVTFMGAQGFLPPGPVLKADEVFVDAVRLPYQKFLRNPRG